MNAPTDELDLKLPLIAKLLLVMLCEAAATGERVNAFKVLRRALDEVDPGGHGLVERLTTPPVSDADMQRVFDEGRRVEAELQRQSVLVTPKQPSFRGNRGVGQTTGSTINDHDRIRGHDVCNGYPWSSIAEHCVDNQYRIPGKHHGFLEDMNDKLSTGYGSISGAQARYLLNLFAQYLGGRIQL